MTSTALHPDDYRVVVQRFRDEYGDRRTRGWSRGVNFMTPEVLGFVAVDGDVVEVSTGMGFDGSRIYGVSYRDACDERSQLCHTWAEVRAVLGGAQ
jgi:hypothetical protein